MTNSKNFVWFIVPFVVMVAIAILAMAAIHASFEMPLVLSSVTWNSDVAKELASVTWNSRIISLIC